MKPRRMTTTSLCQVLGTTTTVLEVTLKCRQCLESLVSAVVRRDLLAVALLWAQFRDWTATLACCLVSAWGACHLHHLLAWARVPPTDLAWVVCKDRVDRLLQTDPPVSGKEVVVVQTDSRGVIGETAMATVAMDTTLKVAEEGGVEDLIRTDEAEAGIGEIAAEGETVAEGEIVRAGGTSREDRESRAVWIPHALHMKAMIDQLYNNKPSQEWEVAQPMTIGMALDQQVV